MSKILAFKLNQKNDFEWEIFISKLNIFQLIDIILIKNFKQNITSDICDDITKTQTLTVEWSFLQRQEINPKLNAIVKYLKSDLGIFPNSIILWSKDRLLSTNLDNNLDKNLFEINVENFFYVIDWQHRLKWFIRYLLGEIQSKEEIKWLSEEKWDLDKIRLIIKQLGRDKIIQYQNEYIFEFPIVIIGNITEGSMIKIFSNINSTATKLDPNLKTYLNWRFINDNNLENKLFVAVWKWLNDPIDSPLFNLIKMPYDITEIKKDNKKFLLENSNNYANKIWLYYFVIKSGKLIDVKSIFNPNKDSNYYTHPFNIISDLIYKKHSNLDEKSLYELLTLRLLILYNKVFLLIKETYWLEKINKKKYSFLNSNNISIYIQIIWIIIKEISKEFNGNNDSELFTDKNIKLAFNKYILKSLTVVYEQNSFFIKWSAKGTWEWKIKEMEDSFISKYYYNNYFNESQKKIYDNKDVKIEIKDKIISDISEKNSNELNNKLYILLK